MAHRHKVHKHHGKHHKDGGKIAYNAQGSHVLKEAEERKHGGKVHGHHAKHRLDRKHRKRGGRVGSNMHPFSTAHMHEKGNETKKVRPKYHHAN